MNTIVTKTTNTLFSNYSKRYNTCYIYLNVGNKTIGVQSHEITRLYTREVS